MPPATRVLDILDETPPSPEVTGEAEIGFDGAAAENVTFSYGGETILDNVSVDIPAHAVVGIVGRSGSGKSTLPKLLHALLGRAPRGMCASPGRTSRA